MFYIALCTFRPHLGYLREQIESIRAQTDPDFRCLIHDDASPPEIAAEIQNLVAHDPRFRVLASPIRRGVFHNFEAALAHTPADAEFICYCDQDDLWAPEKLARQRAVLADPGVVLCHSDLEIMDEQGATLHRSCFEFEGRNVKDYDLPQLLFRNSVTGCTAAFRASLLSQILPFPEQDMRPAYHHDLWTALNATLVGRIVALREPLVRYRQHAGNVIGAEPRDAAASPRRPLLQQLRSLTPELQAYANEWRLRQRLITELLRRAPREARPEARLDQVRAWMQRAGSVSLWRYASAHRDEHDSLAAVAPRIFWGRLIDVGLQVPTRLQRAASTALTSTEDAVKRGKSAVGSRLRRHRLPEVSPRSRHAPLPFLISAQAEPAINMIVPSLRRGSLFGGLATACRLAVILARRGRRVRMVTSDHPLALADLPSCRDTFVADFGATAEDLQRIEFLDGTVEETPGKLPCLLSSRDTFLATAWWTALRIRETLRRPPFQPGRFVYLIQDYEPGFYAWSEDYAAAQSSYAGGDFLPIYNSSLLAEYFRTYVGAPVRPELILQPQIDLHRYAPPSAEQLRTRPSRRRMFVYGRPRTPRNLFGLLCESLARFIREEGLGASDLEVVAGGEDFEPLALGGGIVLRSLGKLTLDRYAEELRACDLGVSLMLSPHPSYPPLEMAASGLLTVTNRYANKDLHSISDNLISCDATADGVATALRTAWTRVGEVDARIAAARIDLAALGRPLEQVADSLLADLDGETEQPLFREVTTLPLVKVG